MGNLVKILRFTVQDQLRHKSFYALLGMCVLLALLLRSCYGADMVVNGRRLDTAGLIPHFTAFAFQIISCAIFLMTILLSMSVLSRDRKDGAMAMILCRPVRRWQYLFGRIAGTWLFCAVFMIILQGLVFAITWMETGQAVYAIWTASMISSINLLFIVALVSLLSLKLPDVIAALFCFLILGVGFVSETGYRFFHSEFFQTVAKGTPPDPAGWQILFPKSAMVQQYAESLISGGSFQAMGPVHPVINLVLYVAAALTISIWMFRGEEVT
jgi:ABC-type transport system involved in multi-copper enzyme maturation permease subunit